MKDAQKHRKLIPMTNQKTPTHSNPLPGNSLRVRSFLLLSTLLALSTLIMTQLSGPISLKLDLFQSSFLKGALQVRLDFLSSLLLTMVTLLGTIIAHYADRYLEGEHKKDSFFKWLFLTLICVSTFLCSGHLLTLFISWFATSFCLHSLLLFYDNRVNAQKAASKKFIISRLGDLFIIIAIGLLYRQLETLEISSIFDRIQELTNSSQSTPLTLSLSAIFLALGAMTKSAQFPFHFWLPETMEAPTPVSALMHAGIINAGGFLLIRLNPILQIEPIAGIILTFIGGITAVFGSLVMMTQNDIKKKLAYSTISQMGIMISACGLGAFSLALFHILMHSFYKAYAFLSTGALVQESKKISLQSQPISIKSYLKVLLLSALILTIGVYFTEGRNLAILTYVSILALGVFQTLNSISPVGSTSHLKTVFWRMTFTLTFSGLLAGALEFFIHQNLSPLMTVPQSSYPYDLSFSTWTLLCLSFFFLFFAQLMISSLLIHSNQTVFKRLYFHLWNGFYFNSFTDTLFNLNQKQARHSPQHDLTQLKTQEQFYA